jgi:hypothetical protein
MDRAKLDRREARPDTADDPQLSVQTQERNRLSVTAQILCAEAWMRRLLCVLFILISAMALPPALEARQGSLTAQGGDPEYGFRVLQNYPNPFTSDTRIPFELHAEAFPEGRPAVVSMRIFNVLRELVATPTTLGHPAGDGTEVTDLDYTSQGRHEVYWSGLNRSGAPVPVGVYLLEVSVNGRVQVVKMFRR